MRIKLTTSGSISGRTTSELFPLNQGFTYVCRLELFVRLGTSAAHRTVCAHRNIAITTLNSSLLSCNHYLILSFQVNSKRGCERSSKVSVRGWETFLTTETMGLKSLQWLCLDPCPLHRTSLTYHPCQPSKTDQTVIVVSKNSKMSW